MQFFLSSVQCLEVWQMFVFTECRKIKVSYLIGQHVLTAEEPLSGISIYPL